MATFQDNLQGCTRIGTHLECNYRRSVGQHKCLVLCLGVSQKESTGGWCMSVRRPLCVNS